MKRTLYLTLLFSTLLCTRGRAQLMVEPPAFTYLSGQLSELSLNGELGPTRLALAQTYLAWNPSYFNSSYTGTAPGALAAGLLNNRADYFVRRKYNQWPIGLRTVASLGQDLQALKLVYRNGDSGIPEGSLRFMNTEATEGRPGGTTLLGNAHVHFGGYEYYGGVGVEVFDRQLASNRDFNRAYQRHSAYTYHEWSPGEVAIRADLLARFESADRNFEERKLRSEREFGQATVSVRDEQYYGNRFFHYQGEISFRILRDSLAGTGPTMDRLERRLDVMGTTEFNVYPFKLAITQRYLMNRLDPDRYLPNLQLSLFPARNKLQFAAFLNRGGNYRNPLLIDDHLSRTRRNHALQPDLTTEDFWRYGAEVNGNFAKPGLSFNVQAVQRDYRNYVAVRYPDQATLEITQLAGVSRSTVAAELVQEFFDKSLTLSLNYRYDLTEIPGAANGLLPAKHAGWARASFRRTIGSGSDWIYGLDLSYLRQSTRDGLDTEQLNEAADRMDASLHLLFQYYRVSLQAEHLFRSDIAYALGRDPNGGVPLGDEHATLAPRYFSVTLGASF